MIKNRIVKLNTILYFGAVWGITEAVLGYILHLLPNLISGLVMFPIATFILLKAYRSLHSKKYLLFIGIVAAAIKSVNLLLPGLSIYKTINPMTAIILESMVVLIVIPFICKEDYWSKMTGAVAISILWRIGFALYVYGVYLLTGNSYSWTVMSSQIYRFILIKGAFSGLLVFGVLLAEGHLDFFDIKERKINFFGICILFFIALVTNYFL